MKTNKQTKCKVKSPVSIAVPYALKAEYITRRIDMRLTQTESLAMRRVFDGLRTDGATLANGNKINNAPDVIRWWLQRVYEEMYGDLPAVEVSPATFR